MHLKKGGIKAWLTFVVLIVLIFSALYFYRSELPEIGKSPDVAEQTTKPSKKFATDKLSEDKKTELDTAAMHSAMNRGSVSDCDKITYDEDLRKQCMDALGYASILRSGDESKCDDLFNEELKSQCRDKILYSSAMNNFDSSLCKKISNPELSQRCLDQLQAVLGKDAESADDCDSIIDPSLKQECLNNFYYSDAVDKMDTDTCNKINSTTLRERCNSVISENKEVVEIAKVQKESKPVSTKEAIQTCDSYSNPADIEKCKDNGNYELALEEKDLSYCNRISDTSLKMECIEVQGDNINQYYFRQGTAYSNASFCNKITNISLKTLCLDSI